MYDLMALAFQADATRVVSFCVAPEGSNRPFNDIGISSGHHDLSHHKNTPDIIAKVQLIDRWYVQRLAAFLEKMQAVTYQTFRDAPLRAVAGVKDAVTALQAAGLYTCVASSGAPEKMRFTLGLTGLWDLFDGRIFSASQVPRGKPFPDLFLHAALSMNVQPFECVVVEDSLPGVQAARAAGMKALAYAGEPYANRDALQKAGGRVFDDMKQLPGLVLA